MGKPAETNTDSHTAAKSAAEIAAQFINQTDKSVFLTGKAGTGKTTFLKHIVNETHKRAIVVAPTGIAAINAGGTTIHSQFQLPFGPFLPTAEMPLDLPENLVFNNARSLHRQRQLQEHRRRVLERLELLIIDEVSMLRADLLDAIDSTLRDVRHYAMEPFGGVQVLFIGDLMQLPPVVKREEWVVLQRYYKSIFFFDAAVLQEAPPVYIELDKIYRQTDSTFIDILNNLRNNRIESADMAVLNRYYRPDFIPKPDDGYITLTTHNVKAAELNETSLAALEGTAYEIEAEIEGDFPELMYPTERKLPLKVGAQIMFIKNDPTGEQRFFNGKIAKVTQIEPIDDSHNITVTFNDKGEKLVLEKYEWRNIKFQVNETSKEIEEDMIGTFTQYPIKLAWAITVHKSQGLTFEKAVIDVGKAFAAGQIYVALSRLTGLDGLILSSPINMRGISNNVQVAQYAATKPDATMVATTLSNETFLFVRDTIFKTYNFTSLVFAIRQHQESYNKSEQNSEKQKQLTWATALMDKVPPLSNYAQNFTKQLNFYFNQQPIDWQKLNERLTAARDYFTKEFGYLIKELLLQKEKMAARSKTKGYREELENLETQVFNQFQQFHKAAILVTCVAENKPINKAAFNEPPAIRQRFDILQQVKLEIETTKKTLPNPEKTEKYNFDAPFDHHWAREIEPIYSTEVDMPIRPLKKKKTKNSTLSDTIQKTLDLHEKGKNIEEIALERGMSIPTIYTHIFRLLEKRLVYIGDLMDDDSIDILLQAWEMADDWANINDIYEQFSGKYSLEEIQMMKIVFMTDA
jgi:hypothetical protein